jgi:murein L,D-transpeptidase YcbB/YkuD
MKYLLPVLLFFFCLSSCNRCSSEKPKVDLVENPEKIQSHVTDQIANQLGPTSGDGTSLIHINSYYLKASKLVRRVYLLHKKESFWNTQGKLNRQGDTLLSLFRNARVFGLIPKDYYVPQVDSLLNTARDKNSGKVNAVNYAQADILMTDAFFLFVTHLQKGRLRSDTILPEFRISEVRISLDSLFQSAIEKNNFRACFESLEPKQEQYKLLKLALAKFRATWEAHPWDTLPRIEKDTAAFYKALKKMLVQTHDFDSTVKGNDSVKLSKAIKVFQKRYYLEQDGKLGKNTMPVIRMSVEQRIRQIEMNMERWRLEQPRFPKRYVMVNIPQFEMKVVDEDTIYLTSKVIVGLPEKPTPLLESQIQYIMLYPYWNVPFSIASKEILPVLKRDTSYLRKKNFDVLDWNGYVVDPTKINWKRFSVTYLPYRFRQREGEDNSLGIMKFNFNNKFGVYMHDTNAKKYFKRDVRALSHGCMRIENYMELAKYLIRLDSVKYPYDSLLTDIMKEKQKQINLKKPIPVFTKYFTAMVDEDLGLQLFMDIYRKDEQMESVLYK